MSTPKPISQGEFTVAGITLKVHNLDNGQRVIEKEGMDELMAKMFDGSLDASDAMRAAQIVNGDVLQ